MNYSFIIIITMNTINIIKYSITRRDTILDSSARDSHVKLPDISNVLLDSSHQAQLLSGNLFLAIYHLFYRELSLLSYSTLLILSETADIRCLQYNIYDFIRSYNTVSGIEYISYIF